MTCAFHHSLILSGLWMTMRCLDLLALNVDSTVPRIYEFVLSRKAPPLPRPESHDIQRLANSSRPSAIPNTSLADAAPLRVEPPPPRQSRPLSLPSRAHFRQPASPSTSASACDGVAPLPVGWIGLGSRWLAVRW
ncbi:hypothetical protein IWZ01DRAFT_196356 [Phyllosticta capitalensis]